MFKFLLVLSCLLVAVFGYNPMKVNSRMTMKVDQPNAAKLLGAAIMASSMMSMPVLAKEGTPAKIGIFESDSASSPFAEGIQRSEPNYSPYSPYGDGTNAVYKLGSSDEMKFWSTTFNNAVKRTEKIPSYVAKKTWSEVQGELTRYNYNMRESMLRLASQAKDTKAANAAAKAYFADLGDVFVCSKKKSPEKTLAAYEQSVKDLNAFKAAL
mmetsp:Transcript_46745/g.130162  ORF Transcript_46745/g.130162 Transcript_46745/m.130162 type:complete len:211 (+) Transcript_46745:46-678(+)